MDNVVDYKTIRREYEERVVWLNSMYGKPSDRELLSRVVHGVRRVVKFTKGRVSFGQEVRVRSRVSAPTAE